MDCRTEIDDFVLFCQTVVGIFIFIFALAGLANIFRPQLERRFACLRDAESIEDKEIEV